MLHSVNDGAMTPASSPSTPRCRRRLTRILPLAVPVVCLVLAGCGGSSKPGYCSSVDKLKSSIKAIPNTNVIQNGTNALKSQLTEVENNAKAVVDGAKKDFPNETDALKSAVNGLSTTITQLTSSPSAATIAQVPAQISAVSTTVQNFTSATKSKCS
jgi:hypothetical protein